MRSYKPREEIKSMVARYLSDISDATEIQETIRVYKIGHLSYSQIAERLSLPIETILKLCPAKRLSSVRMPTNPPVTRLGKLPRALNVKIISRFLKGKEFDALLASYQLNTKNKGFLNRATSLNIPISEDEISLIRSYVTETDKPIADIAKEANVKLGNLYSKIVRIALRLIAQNPSILDSVALDKQI